MEKARPLPRLDGPNALFWAGLKAGEIRVQRCVHCGTCRFPASRWCAACRKEGHEIAAVDPVGVVEGVCVFHKQYFAGIPTPYAVVQVRLDCGVRFFSNMRGVSPDGIRTGDRVRAAFVRAPHDVTLLEFTPAEGKIR
jgi:hypothetical protein